eukprot:1158546-Pelagomonas_calceolata.AAC.9
MNCRASFVDLGLHWRHIMINLKSHELALLLDGQMQGLKRQACARLGSDRVRNILAEPGEERAMVFGADGPLLGPLLQR